MNECNHVEFCDTRCLYASGESCYRCHFLRETLYGAPRETVARTGRIGRCSRCCWSGDWARHCQKRPSTTGRLGDCAGTRHMRETSSVQLAGIRAIACSRGTMAARNRRQNGGSNAVHGAVGQTAGSGATRNAPVPRTGSGPRRNAPYVRETSSVQLRDRRAASSRDTPAARNRRQNGGSDAAHGVVG